MDIPKYLAFGVDQKDGGFVAVSEVHEPCKGDPHKGCVVLIRHIVSPVFKTEEEADDALSAFIDVCREKGAMPKSN